MINQNNEHDTGERSERLTHQQQRFCDLYLTHFNAFKAAVESGYSENTSRKGALLHVPKIQRYLQEVMSKRSQRLEITHDIILRELSKIAFSNMGNYYDEYACLKRMNELTVDEKAAISYYDIVEMQDAEGYRVGTQSRIKLHNKMSALDKIARHLNFYGTVGLSRERGVVSPESKAVKEEVAGAVAVVDRSTNDLPMDYPVEDFELEGIELKTLVVLEEVDVSPGCFSRESEVESLELDAASDLGCSENIENILTISPLLKSQNSKVKIQNDFVGDDGVREFALRMGADTGLAMGLGQAVASRMSGQPDPPSLGASGRERRGTPLLNSKAKSQNSKMTCLAD